MKLNLIVNKEKVQKSTASKRTYSNKMGDFFTYQKKRGEVGYRPPAFSDTEVKVLGFLPTQREGLDENHLYRNPNFLMIDNIPEMSERLVNTERVTTVDRGMAHKEGGNSC